MSRYDLYRVTGSSTLLLDVQADLLEGISSRVVVPLAPVGELPMRANPLNPVFEIAGVSYFLVTPSLAAIPAASLGAAIANLSNRHDQITRALDFLFQGY